MFTDLTFNHWYEKLSAAVLSPRSQKMDEVIDLVKHNGVYQLRSTGLRQASASILEEHSAELPLPSKHLLDRLRNAGRQPSYPKYTALDVLIAWYEIRMTPPDFARMTFQLVDEMVAHLLVVEELREHDKRNKLEARVNAILDAVRSHSFYRDPVGTPPVELIQLSLIPESGLSDELVFLRVVQATEIIFYAGCVLAASAIDSIDYGDLLDAVLSLHWIRCFSETLIPLLRLLSSTMTKENWIKIRPFIVSPSAIQSTNFHCLSTRLHEIGRILGHPRHHQCHKRYLSLCHALLDELVSELAKWDRAHTAIAAKYGHTEDGSVPAGVAWLKERTCPFLHE